MSEANNIPETDKKRIIIIGGGYGGLKLGRELKNSGYQVLMLDKNNYHQFQPLLYQVATAGLEATSVSFPIRQVFHNYQDFHFRLAELIKLDAENNEIITNIGKIRYDYLVLATGTDNNFFGNPNIEKYSYPLKSTTEALNLRNFILQNNEDALSVNNKDERKALLSVVVVGGGATGIEIAGAIAEMREHVLPKDYPELDYSEMDIFLYSSGNRLLNGLTDLSSRKAIKYLEKLGVKVVLNTKLQDYDGKTAYLNNGQQQQIRTVIWGAGVRCLKIDGLKNNVCSKSNRLYVDRFNKVKEYDNIFAIGDLAEMSEGKFSEGHPQVANVAIQQAIILAENFKRIKDNKIMKKFAYYDKGIMATIGKNLAIVELPYIKFYGVFAWFFFMFVHLMSILVINKKLSKFLHWSFKYFTYDKSLRLILRFGHNK